MGQFSDDDPEELISSRVVSRVTTRFSLLRLGFLRGESVKSIVSSTIGTSSFHHWWEQLQSWQRFQLRSRRFHYQLGLRYLGPVTWPMTWRGWWGCWQTYQRGIFLGMNSCVDIIYEGCLNRIVGSRRTPISFLNLPPCINMSWIRATWIPDFISVTKP